MNEVIINLRQEQLKELQEYVKDIDKDITLILQSLQWDRKHLEEGKKMETCKFDSNHRILTQVVQEHEKICYLKSLNYMPGDQFFPEPLDSNANTVVKLSLENINDIINYAVKTDPSFKRSGPSGVPGHAPLTLGGLQAAHTADERRALYDAVAAAAPRHSLYDPPARDAAAHDPTATSAATELQALRAQRDARRRRVRHRRAAKDGYRLELRGLISAQMESFAGDRNDPDAEDEIDDGRRHGRDDTGAKSLNPNKRERGESRDNERKRYERESGDRERRECEGERGAARRREYDYVKKSKERNKIIEHDDGRHRRHDKKRIEIKGERDGSSKRETRNYDYTDRKRERVASGSRDNKRYHRREERHHRHDSVERQRGRRAIDYSHLKEFPG